MSLVTTYKVYAIGAQSTPFYITGSSYQTFPVIDIDTSVSSKFRHFNDFTVGGVISVLEGEVDVLRKKALS